MHFEKLAQSLRLLALAMFSIFLLACSDGDGPDEIVDPLFTNCPGPNCVLNPIPPPPGPVELLTNGSFEDGTFLPWINAGFITGTPPDGTNDFYTADITMPDPMNPFTYNLSQVLTTPPLINGDTYTLNFRARANVDPCTLRAGIGEDGGGFLASSVDLALTTVWQGYSFDLVVPGDVTVNGGRVLFDMGFDVCTIDIDDVSVTPIASTGLELVTDGSFETGIGSWQNRGLAGGTVVPEVGNDSSYNVDVLAAGNPFDVNLSQVFTITPGVTYKLTFRARTDRVTDPPMAAARSMLAGLGLNEAPFTAECSASRSVAILHLYDHPRFWQRQQPGVVRHGRRRR